MYRIMVSGVIVCTEPDGPVGRYITDAALFHTDFVFRMMQRYTIIWDRRFGLTLNNIKK